MTNPASYQNKRSKVDVQTSIVSREPAARLLSLPTDVISRILSFDRPELECQAWEWICRISLTCKTILNVAQRLAPTDFTLEDFVLYPPLNGGDEFDARHLIIKALCKCSWMRDHLQEIHISHPSTQSIRRFDGSTQAYLITLIRSLITAPNALPKLEWLDIALQNSIGLSNVSDLVDEDTLMKLPLALPSLRRLCLDACFRSGEGMEREITPYQLEKVFSRLTSLATVSFHNPAWMTDAHVAAIMPIVGKSLTCLELISCIKRGYTSTTRIKLTDAALEAIASNTGNLTSFAIPDSDITSAGLERVLKANPSIAILNLSYCENLDDRAMNVVSCHLPGLRQLRCYWSADRHDTFGGTRKDLWFNDDSLMALIKSQERVSTTSSIPLKLVGILKRTNVTSKSLRYAMEKGVTIEIDPDHNESLYDELQSTLDADFLLNDAKYNHYVDGSRDSEAATVIGLSESHPNGFGLDDFAFGFGAFMM